MTKEDEESLSSIELAAVSIEDEEEPITNLAKLVNFDDGTNPNELRSIVVKRATTTGDNETPSMWNSLLHDKKGTESMDFSLVKQQSFMLARHINASSNLSRGIVLSDQDDPDMIASNEEEVRLASNRSLPEMQADPLNLDG